MLEKRDIMIWISNVLMETGRENLAGGKVKTLSQKVALGIDGNKIVAIEKNVPEDVEEVIDGKNYLVLPSFIDNHIHLDKTHFGGPWQAVVPMDGVAERIKEEEGFLEDFLPTTYERAQKLIDLLISKGATALKVQVNVDPIIGLKNFEIIKQVLQDNRDRIAYQIVAFPQHGLIKTEQDGYISTSLQDNAMNALGGVDPATIDVDIEKTLKLTFDLAKKYDKDIDIHIHDLGTLGLYQIKRIIHYTNEYEYQGRVQISHAYSLGGSEKAEIMQIAQDLAAAQIDINTTIPIDVPTPDVPTLLMRGVRVRIINDNINDHWSPFGSGDLLERCSRAAEIFNVGDEVGLASYLALITNGITPLDEEGQFLWPNVNDEANLVFIKAECSAQAVARVPRERVVMFQGNITSGTFE